MRKRVMLATSLVMALGVSAQAQQPNPATSPQSRWEIGTQIYDASGRWIGLLGQVNPDGSIVMWGVKGNPNRTLPAGSLHRTGEELMTATAVSS